MKEIEILFYDDGKQPDSNHGLVISAITRIIQKYSIPITSELIKNQSDLQLYFSRASPLIVIIHNNINLAHELKQKNKDLYIIMFSADPLERLIKSSGAPEEMSTKAKSIDKFIYKGSGFVDELKQVIIAKLK